MTAELSLVWAIVLAPGAFAVAGAAIGQLWNRPRVDRSEVRDVLILAAHSDDCVVCAGEYAIDAAAAGRQIWVLYLTCGDYQVGSARARTRDREALACWESLGVPADRIVFLGLACSQLNGPAASHEVAELEDARERIMRTLRSMPSGAAVFLPAEGESHSDHRLLRLLARECLERAERPDLVALEAPEYNLYVSLWRMPRRGVRVVLRWLPLLSRIGSQFGGAVRASFPSGPPGLLRPDDPVRLAKKRELFRFFESENPELLARCFGHPDLYRPMNPRLPPETARGYVRMDAHHLGPSMVLLLWSLVSAGFAGAATIGHWGRSHIDTDTSAWVLPLVGAAIVGTSLKRGWNLLQRIWIAGVGIGLAAGSFGVWFC